MDTIRLARGTKSRKRSALVGVAGGERDFYLCREAGTVVGGEDGRGGAGGAGVFDSDELSLVLR